MGEMSIRSRYFFIIIAILALLLLGFWLHHYQKSLRFNVSDMTLEEQIAFIQRPDNYDDFAIIKTIRHLGRNKATEAVPALIYVLEHRTRRLGAEAAWALGEIGDPRAIKPLIFSMDHMVRTNVDLEAYYALVKFGERAVPELISALHAKKINHRRDVIDALGNIGDERALGPLRKIFLYGSQSESSDAGNALEGIGKSSFYIFVKGLDSDKVYVKINAVSGLGGIEWPNENPETIHKIEKLLEHPHERVRSQAARTLGRKRSASSCLQLKKAVLTEKDQNARQKMSWAINVLGACKLQAETTPKS